MGERDNTSDIGTDIPDIGVDASPSAEMIVQGKVGNGTWDRIDSSDAAKELQELRQEQGRKRKQLMRAKAIEAELDMQDKIIDNRSLMHDTANVLHRKMANGEELTKFQMDYLKMADASGWKVTEDLHGKASTKHEITTHNSILALIRQESPSND